MQLKSDIVHSLIFAIFTLTNKKSYEYTIINAGDVNGDGKISALDYVKIKNHIMKDEEITVGELYGMTEEEIMNKSLTMMDALGIKEAFNKRLSSFSKGMRQKVLIISSLLHDPDILFWDEPLSGLDANSVQVIREVLIQLRDAGKTIFYSSHVMDMVQRLSDRILILHNGEVVANGPFEELKEEAEGTLEQLFNTLTGFDEHASLADQFIKGMKGERADDA